MLNIMLQLIFLIRLAEILMLMVMILQKILKE